MRNFSEEAFENGGMSVLDYFSKKENQESLLDEVKQFGDAELSGAFEELFLGDNNPVEIKRKLKNLLDSNNQRELVKECIAIRDYSFIKKLLKRKDIDWYAERLIVKIGDIDLINLLLNRSNLGWASQNLIAETNNKEWILKLLKKQKDLSPNVKDYVVDNCNDECVIKLIKWCYLPYEVIFSIVRKRSEACIREVVNKYSFLPDNILIEIAKMENIEITESLLSKYHLSDNVLTCIVDLGDETLINKISHFRSLGPSTQKAIIRYGKADFIREVMHQFYLVPGIKAFIAKTLNPLLIKEFVGSFNDLNRIEREIILSAKNPELIRLLNA